MLCISGFVDDVKFTHNGPHDAWLIGHILKVTYRFQPNFHSDKDQILFVDDRHTPTTSLKWRMAAIFQNIDERHISATVRQIAKKVAM